jgi:hypothetical protein
MSFVPGVGRSAFRAYVVLAILLGCVATADAERIKVAAGGSLQAALDQAQPGDVVLLAPGATFSGNFVLRKKAGDAFITVQSDVEETGPLTPGRRITPAAAAGLARIVSPNSGPALQTQAGAHHWRIQLLQFGPTHKGYGEIIRFGDGSSAQNALALVPYQLVLDRVYIYGDPRLGQKRGVAINAREVTVSNSHISDIKGIGQDTQALGAWNGPGPFVIENNYLEAAGENFLLGGSGPDIPNLVATGVTFRRNHLSRPVSWRDPIVPSPTGVTAAPASSGALAAATYTYLVTARRPAGQVSIAESAPSTAASVALGAAGAVAVTWDAVEHATEYRVYRQVNGETRYWTVTGTSWTDAGASAGTAGTPGTGTRWLVKNIFELKNARDVLVEQNLFEHNWAAGQAGYAIVFTVRNSSGTCTWCTIENVTFRYNVVRHVAGGINILGYDSPEVSAQGKNFRIEHNLFYDVNGTRWGGTGIFLLIGDEPRDIVVDHNTIDHSGTSLVSVYGGTSADRREVYGFRYTNNLARHGKYGVFGNGMSTGTSTINTYFPGSEFRRNLFSGGSASKYPIDNFFGPAFDDQFTDWSSGDFTLLNSSPFKNAGTDGKDLGADIARLAAAFAAALSDGEGADSPVGDPPAPGLTQPKGLRFQGGS